MNSTLKILVDTPCQVYCDYELKGEAIPDSIFRLILRKGAYILEFKNDETTLLASEYVMQSNDEEDLLRVELQKIQANLVRELKSKEIAKRSVSIKWHDNKNWIKDVSTDIEYQIDENYNFHSVDYFLYTYFDKNGLLTVNIGGEYDELGVIIGGKFGCINKNGELQIPIIYDSPISFTNENVATATIGTKIFFINKWGEIAFENEYDEVLEFIDYLCVVGINGKYGVINEYGKLIIPVVYEQIKLIPKKNEVIIWAGINNKWGKLDKDAQCILPFQFDEIVHHTYSDNICVRIGKFWGIIDFEGNSIVPIDYEIISYRSGFYHAIVRRGSTNKYGVSNTNFIKDTIKEGFKEIIPCIYDAIYYEYGIEFDYEKEKKTAEYGNPYGDKIFVIKNDPYINCFVYSIDGNYHRGATLLFNFECSSFNREKIILNDKEGILNYFSYGGRERFKETPEVLLLPIIYDKVENLNDYFWSLCAYGILKNNLWGIVSVEGELLVECICSEIISVNEVRIIIIINGFFAVYTFSSKSLIVYDGYEEIKDLRVDVGKKYLGAKKNGKWAIVYDDEPVTAFEFDDLYAYTSDGYTDIIELKKYIDNRTLFGTFSRENSVQTEPCIFLTDSYYRNKINHFAEVYDSDTKKEGVMSKITNEIVVPCIYDYIRIFKNWSGMCYVIGKEVFDTNKGYSVKYAIANLRLEMLTEYLFDDFKPEDGSGRLYIGNLTTESYINGENLVYEVPFLRIGFYGDDNNGKFEFINKNPFTQTILFLDTETTGLPLSQNVSYENFENWPYLVQIGFILYDKVYGKLATRNIIIAPKGYEIPSNSTNLHGVSNAYAVENGENRESVLHFMDKILANVNTIVGHNVDFDINVLKCEILRMRGSEKPFFARKYHNIVDTMKVGVDICKLPSPKYDQKYKWPTLDELYNTLFHKSFNGAHNAMNDVQATYECYFEMKKQNLIR